MYKHPTEFETYGEVLKEINRLRAENEALIEDRDKWMMRARMLWFGYRLTERMQMPEEGRWFSGEGSDG